MNYFYINNTKINHFQKNKNIIDFLESLNIKIPHYCYHKNLSVAGNCRMCLIELKNSPKPLVSCSMTITNKMEIFTESPLVKKARENVLEFLLLNHPLDCPICDQGGECDLQDQSMVFGLDKKRFYNYKRSVSNKNIGPIVKTVMTRCIHCTRCVRFATEIASNNSLGVFGRGNKMEIGTYISSIIDSELSGNLIDICPVGALTSKPYSFIDRNWELSNIKTLDFCDTFNLHVQLSVKNNNTISKIVPIYNKNDIVNCWLSDKTRFSFDGIFSPERLSKILIVNNKNNNNFRNEVLTWKTLFKEIQYFIYFQLHLSKKLKFFFKLLLIIGNSLSLDTLNLLILLQKKYSFITIKKYESINKLNDQQFNYLTSDKNNFNMNINNSNCCVLIGVNSKNESVNLNMKIRQRFLKGNFKIFAINSFIKSNFPFKIISNSFHILNYILEGTNIFCQNLISAKSPFLIANSQIFKRKDSKNLNLILNNFNKFINFKYKYYNLYNNININLNEVNLDSLNYFKSFSINDLKFALGVYFIETNLKTNKLNKLIELYLLQLIFFDDFNKKYIIEQSTIYSEILEKYKNFNINFSSSIKIPTASLFEINSFFINTEGIFKKGIKSIPFFKNSKNNWQIFFLLLNKLEKHLFSEKIIYKINFYDYFLNYIKLFYFSIFKFKNHKNEFENFYTKKYNIKFINKFKLINSKIYKTKLILPYEDFYVNKKNEYYINYSRIMINCSKFYRLNSLNFKYIL